MEALGGNIPFLINPILLQLEGGRDVVPILPIQLADLVSCVGMGVKRGKKNGGNLVTEKSVAVLVAAPWKNE